MSSSESDRSALLEALRPERVEAHLRFLSSPLLEGRGAGTRGGRLAEEYIRAVFAASRLLPAPKFGYRQEVPMVGMVPRPQLSFSRSGGGALPTVTYLDDYVLKAGIAEPVVEAESELVFVGFGIHAPEYGWDDYGDTDLTGKLLLMRVNDPGSPDDPDFFEGRALTYYGRWTYKYEEAARRGAVGAILIHTDDSAGYGWNVVRSSNSGEQYQLAGDPEVPLRIKGWITEARARQLLAGAQGDRDLLEESRRAGFRPVSLGITARARVESTVREVNTANVLGLLPGSDPARSEEPIIFMAHHDHLGIKVSDAGETLIYPGAYDNASGVAVLLAIAEAFAEAKVQLPRPVLFLASTAEESGLLGSEWYTRYPAFPLSSTAAVLNVDGANLQGPTVDIAPLGTNRSSLGQPVASAAREEGLELRDEQHPEQGMFFRQDHFPFARRGVPGIAFDHGLRYADKAEGWGEQWYNEFISTHYHQPSDSFRDDFDYRGAIQQGRVMLRTAIDVAGAVELPQWNSGSSFRREG